MDQSVVSRDTATGSQDHPRPQSHDPKKAWKAYCGEKVVTSNAVVTTGKCPNPSNTPDRQEKDDVNIKKKKLQIRCDYMGSQRVGHD